jgi:outer membrane protein TolC
MNSIRLSRVLVLLASALQAEPLPFRRAVELAVQRSTVVSAAEQNRAHQAYLAAVRLYIPQLIAGSGLAKTFGYPLSIEGSAPSIVNVNATGFLINPSHREAVRAARAEWDAAAFSSEDRRQQAILDAAVTYTQLDRMVSAFNLLRQQQEEATRAEQITGERVQAGVEPALNQTRSRLATARVRMAIAQVEGDIDMLRNVLAQLTGLPAQGLETITESIPPLPEISHSEDMASKAASTNPAVKLAFAHADAKQLVARGEHKQFMPAVDLVGQYSRFATYNNYEVFFPPGTFRRNNALIGVAVRFPFFNMSQRAHAAAADAEAVQARRQAEDARNKVSNETRKLQHEVAQFAAAREVARLEYQLARAEVDTVQTKVQAGSATLGDEANARLAEGQKYSAFLDASYQYEQAQMQLLRSTGELEKWALAQK